MSKIKVGCLVMVKRCKVLRHDKMNPQCVCGLVGKMHKISKKLSLVKKKGEVWKRGPLFNIELSNGRHYNVVSLREIELLRMKS